MIQESLARLMDIVNLFKKNSCERMNGMVVNTYLQLLSSLGILLQVGYHPYKECEDNRDATTASSLISGGSNMWVAGSIEQCKKLLSLPSDDKKAIIDCLVSSAAHFKDTMSEIETLIEEASANGVNSEDEMMQLNNEELERTRECHSAISSATATISSIVRAIFNTNVNESSDKDMQSLNEIDTYCKRYCHHVLELDFLT